MDQSTRSLVSLQGDDALSQIDRIVGLSEEVGPREHFFGGQIAEFKADLLRAGDLDALPVLDRAHE